MKINKNFAGFTLIELLVTIVIIGILATISISTFNSYQEKAKKAALISKIAQEKKLYKTKCLEFGIGNMDCTVNYSTRRKDGIRYNATALECIDVCKEYDERLATAEEALWFAKTYNQSPNYMWHYANDSTNEFLKIFPMYNNTTGNGWGPTNTGKIPRIITIDQSNYYTDLNSVTTAEKNANRYYEADRATQPLACGCVDYLDF